MHTYQRFLGWPYSAVMKKCLLFVPDLSVESGHHESLSLPDLFRQSSGTWMPGINPGMTGVWPAARPTKKWGTILKKGAPHFPVFPVVEGFCEGQKWVKTPPLSGGTRRPDPPTFIALSRRDHIAFSPRPVRQSCHRKPGHLSLIHI